MVQYKMPPRPERQRVIDELFSPGENGVSDWVDIGRIIEAGLPWSRNGNMRYDCPWGDTRYTWETRRDGIGRTVTGLRMIGRNQNEIETNRPIRDDIRAELGARRCVVCGSTSSIVIDHKNDLYNDPRVLSSRTQTIDDFQPLCNHCNLQKRQTSVEARETKRRYPATRIASVAVFGIDFTRGDETYDPQDPNAMIGTYWYDPVAFMQTVKNKLSNN
jgi:hypothetical protein